MPKYAPNEWMDTKEFIRLHRDSVDPLMLQAIRRLEDIAEALEEVQEELDGTIESLDKAKAQMEQAYTDIGQVYKNLEET